MRMRTLFVLMTSVVIAMPLAASAFAADTATSGSTSTSTTTQSSERLIQKFTPLAGSEANATKLVNGLRNGTAVTLSGTSTGGSSSASTTFTPPTGKMGYGNVNIALSLAQAELTQQGITNPSASDLQKVLMGSGSTQGILQMRADGKGWGQISQSLGFKLGEVMRPAKANDVSKSAQHSDTRVARTETGRPDVQRPDHPERPDKVERPQKVERPEKPQRPERAGR